MAAGVNHTHHDPPLWRRKKGFFDHTKEESLILRKEDVAGDNGLEVPPPRSVGPDRGTQEEAAGVQGSFGKHPSKNLKRGIGPEERIL